MGEGLYIENATAYEMLISQGPAGNSSQGFVEINGPARYFQRWSLDLNQPSTSETSVLARLKGCTFKIIQIRIKDSESFDRIGLSMKHNNIKFLARIEDRQDPRQAPSNSFELLSKQSEALLSPSSSTLSLKRGNSSMDLDEPTLKLRKVDPSAFDSQ